VLLDLKYSCYLADFGLARTISNTTQAMHTGRGTPPYAPPEQHKQLAITGRSDLYSFGVMLYEMFTGQLPWNGEKILGMQQLYTKIEIPDPAEVNQSLPPQLKLILRELTASDPALRPRSAGETVERIVEAFHMQRPPVLETREAGQDARLLLEQKFDSWKTKSKQTWLSPTRFAMVHLEQKRSPSSPMAGALVQFLLYHSIVYAYHDEYWWPQASDPRDQAAASVSLFEKRNDVITARTLAYVTASQNVLALFRSRVNQLCPFFLDLAFQSRTPAVGAQLLALVQSILPAGSEWNDLLIPTPQGTNLGKLALLENEQGDRALELISHARSRSAVEFITKNASRERLSALLTQISNKTGSLPALVKSGVRTQILVDSLSQQLTAQPARLIAAYGTALLGSTLGIALQIYLTYRLPNYMDLTRISSSLIQGLIIGFVFSLGIFLSRLAVERFGHIPFLLRFGTAVLLGGSVTSVAILLFHLLFLNTMPSGPLIVAGCFMIAASYALHGLIPWRIVKMMVSSLAVFGAILGTWGLHTTFSKSITELTPLFQYDLQWSLVRVAVTALCVAIPIGVLGSLLRLDIQED
jgi:hypothetical protein